MPAGVPVATVAIGNARNAALLAVRMLGIADPDLVAEMSAYQEALNAEAKAKNANLTR
jgi:5-(carboxyamino)imidazole ribonucleotide mutase